MNDVPNSPEQPELPRYYVETYQFSKQTIHHGLWLEHPDKELGWKGRRHTYHRIIKLPEFMRSWTLEQLMIFHNL